jgi:hypothetical protein
MTLLCNRFFPKINNEAVKLMNNKSIATLMKTQISKLAILIVLLMGFFISCTKENNGLQNRFGDFKFRLVAMDSAGNEQSVFGAYTNIWLALKIENLSDENFEWNYEYSCGLTTDSDFLLLYKWINNDNSKSGLDLLKIGYPYYFPGYCYLIYNIPLPQKIEPGKSIYVGFHWNTNKDNQPLGKGKYYTKLNHNFYADGFNGQVNLDLNFEMK